MGVRNGSEHFRRREGGSCQPFFLPLLAEAVAILHGVRLALDLGLSHLLVESDAMGVINVLKGGVAPSSDLGLIISDIFFVCSSLNVLRFSFISRKENSVALPMLWLRESFPLFGLTAVLHWWRCWSRLIFLTSL
ncbi:hypothetical protein ACOSP7_020460 [Xanthoceras sorbifolium]